MKITFIYPSSLLCSPCCYQEHHNLLTAICQFLLVSQEATPPGRVPACIELATMRYSSGTNCHVNVHPCVSALHLLYQHKQTYLCTLLGRRKASQSRFTFFLGNEFSNKAKGEKIMQRHVKHELFADLEAKFIKESEDG